MYCFLSCVHTNKNRDRSSRTITDGLNIDVTEVDASVSVETRVSVEKSHSIWWPLPSAINWYCCGCRSATLYYVLHTILRCLCGIVIYECCYS
jgi:hypothetical protein